MKKLSLLFTFCLAILTYTQAQIPPQAFNYSAVARDAGSQPISTTTLGIQISILKTSTAGVVQYSENHFVNTDNFGLFNLVVGGGAVQSGSMAAIAWGNDNYYLKVGMDANGGTNFLTMGTTQLLSVPYALHSATADSLINGGAGFSGDYNDLTNQPIAVTSISANGDTLYLSTGQTFVSGGNSSGTGALVLPTVTTNIVTGITSNSATFGGTISNANGNQIMERGIVYSTSPNPTLNSTRIDIGSGITPYDTILAPSTGYLDDQHVLSANTTYYVRAYAITENNISSYGNEVNFTTLSVGQTGPGGGIVFFDKGNSTGGWQYLESAASDQSAGSEWGCDGIDITGADGTALGTGYQNTLDIEAGCVAVGTAADICANLTLGGYSDWFLPSDAALILMWKNLASNNLGGFSGSKYWSSSEYDNFSARVRWLANGQPSEVDWEKSNTYSVRAF